MAEHGRAAPSWIGSEFRVEHTPDGLRVICGACRPRGHCQLGLALEPRWDDGAPLFDVTCPPEHEGGPSVAHGGWVASVLDEVLGRIPLLHEVMTVTARLTVEYHRPVPVERPLVATAWTGARDGGRWTLHGDLRMATSRALLASAAGTWVERDPSRHFPAFRSWLAEQDAWGDRA